MNKELKQTQDLRLTISSHVVRQLGEELITEPEQAVLELIKNAHDAAAKTCTISIDPQVKEEIANKVCFLGRITIDDAGDGMTLKDIKDSWLHISGSKKRSLRRQKLNTKDGRRLTGEKGLGRLSSMRLGQYLRMTTFVYGSNIGHEVGLGWYDFETGKALDEVEITHREIESNGDKKGTKIEIFGLNQLEYWNNSKNMTLFARKLYALTFPFEKKSSSIKLFLNYCGKTHDLPDTATDVEHIAVQIFDYSFEQTPDSGKYKLTVTARLSLKTFLEHKLLILGSEKYRQFYEYLTNKVTSLGDWSFEFNPNSDFEITASTTKYWEDIASREKQLESPGPFSAKIYNINFNKTKLNGTISKEEAKALVGVWAYKDGFRIGNDKNYDWLKLTEEQSSGRSYFSLSPSNVIGYFDFDGYENSALKETSNREGFVSNYAYQGFWEITREMFTKTNFLLHKYRRAIVEFEKKHEEKEAGKPENYTAQNAISDIHKFSTSLEKNSTGISKIKCEI